MKAAVLYAPKEPLRVEQVEVSPPHQGEVLLRFVATGLCHSDYHIMRGDIPWPTPVVLGHEGAGIVEAIGPGVSRVRVGDHVICCMRPTCGRCRFCNIGRPNLCVLRDEPSHLMRDGSTRFSRDGRPVHHFMRISSFAERSVVPEEWLVSIRRDAPLDKVCLISCGVATGVLSAFNRAKVAPGSSVAVFGVGGIGLSVVQGAVLCGAHRIIAIDVKPKKLEMAQRFGATHVVDASRENVVARVRELNNGWGVDYAFEAVGLPQTMGQALEATGRGGMTVIIGIPPFGTKVPVDVFSLFEERVVTGSSIGGVRQLVDIPMLVDLYMSGKLKLDEMITNRWRLEEINRAYEVLLEGETARSIIVYD